MAQNALNVIAKIKPDQLQSLEALLDSIGNDIANNPYIPFAQISSLHFACWVILDRDPAFPPVLVLESSFDNDLDAHLNELVQCASSGLDAIYSKCEGYPADGATNLAALKQYLQQHAAPTVAFYIGCYGQSLPSIRNAMELRDKIECYLDQEQAKGGLAGLSGPQILAKIKAFVNATPILPPYKPTVTYDSILARSRTNMLLWILLAIVLFLPLLPFLLIYTALLRWHEQKEARTPGPTPLPIDPRLFAKEDIFTQNHLTTLVNVKPGRFRLWTLKTVLWLINKLAKTVFIAGNLGGIPTIHFARWLLIDNDRRLLFFSNYDGSWASYLGDFVDKANYGLTGVWSNTESFPASSFLFFGGARHIEAFKQWSREHNVYANVWYSAYPDATVSNITNAVQIRDGLARTLNAQETEQWLKRL